MGPPTEKQVSNTKTEGGVATTPNPVSPPDDRIILNDDAKGPLPNITPAIGLPVEEKTTEPLSNITPGIGLPVEPASQGSLATTLRPPIGSTSLGEDEESCVSELTVESVSTLIGRRHWYPTGDAVSIMSTIPDEMALAGEEASAAAREGAAALGSSSSSHTPVPFTAGTAATTTTAAAPPVQLNRAIDLLARDDIREISTRRDPLKTFSGSEPTTDDISRFPSSSCVGDNPENTAPGAFPVTGISGYAPARMTPVGVGVALVSAEGGGGGGGRDPMNIPSGGTATAGGGNRSHNEITATPVDDNSTRRDDLMEAQPLDMDAAERKQAERKRWLWFAWSFFAAALIAVIVVVAVIAKTTTTTTTSTTTDSGGLDNPSSLVLSSEGPSQSPTSIVDILLPDVPTYTLTALEDASSPQSKALEWLVNHPNVTGMEEGRKLQLFALATFFYSLNGEKWTNNTGWLDPSLNECDWFGWKTFIHFGGSFVYYHDSNRTSVGPCNEQGEYEMLWLYQNGLEGTFPPELFWLTNLKAISVYSNDNLGGTLSSHVGQLSKLEALWIQRSKISGTIPTVLGTLTNLMTFSIVRNDMTGPIPSQLGLLSANLDTLYLDNNALTGPIPSEFTQLTGLRSLYLGHNSLSGTIHPGLGTLPKLTSILFTNAGFTGTIPTSFGSLSSLDWLSLNKNQLTGSLPTQLGLISQLKGIWVNQNNLGGPIPSQYGSFVNLTHFILYENALSGPIPSELGQATSAVVVRMSNNNFGGSIPSELGRMKDASTVRLHHNQLVGSIPSQLGLMTSMKLLNLEDNNLTGFIPSELGWLALNASLDGFNVTGNAGLVGTIPEDLCLLPKKEATVSWVVPHMDYTCFQSLCGCDDCPCGFNGTTTNDTSIGVDGAG